MKLHISAFSQDTSIQCRASIDTAIVDEYAAAMVEGATFPAIVAFGTAKQAFIGDGWHRYLAACRAPKVLHIETDLRPGGRAEALRFALSANAAHGHRRTNRDKRRCVEIAVREFPELSSHAIADLCAVGDDLVNSIRSNQVSENDTSTRTGRDGKQYPATRRSAGEIRLESEIDAEIAARGGTGAGGERPDNGPSRVGLRYAEIAISQLQNIPRNDAERDEALDRVAQWIEENR